MDVYIPLIFYILIVSLFFRKNKMLLLLFTFVPLLLFWGTKVDFGSDYMNYLMKFERQHDMPFSFYLLEALGGKFEPGFFLLLKVMPSFNAVVFFTALFLLVAIVIFFIEFIPDKFLPLALFLWLFNSSIFNTFSAMRSSYIIAFFLLAFVAKNRGKNGLAILLTIIGAQFHMSGYLLVLFFMLPRNFFIKNLSYFSIFVFSFALLSLLIPSFFSSLLSSIMESNDNVNQYEDYVTGTSYGLGFYIFSTVRIFFIIYIYQLIKQRKIEEKYVWVACFAIFCYLFKMIQGVNITYRFFNYLFLFTVVIQCYTLKVDKTIASKIYVGLSIIYALFNFINYMSSDQMPYYEHYNSFLFQ